MNKTLSLVDVLQRTLAQNKKDITPLLGYLDTTQDELNLLMERSSTHTDAQKIADYLRKMGSNDIANVFRNGENVKYEEIVCDVGEKLKVEGVSKGKPVEINEELIIQHLFSDALKKMSDGERSALMRSMNLSEKDQGAILAGTLMTSQVMLNQFGGFAVYRMSVILANMLARSLVGSGLNFAANAALVRGVGAFLGPIGWIASGAWLAVEIAGPAFRKTVPAIVHIAMLRQNVLKRLTISVVGDGSVGKDALFKSVFGVDTGNISPIAGSTSDTKVYDLGHTGTIKLINFPGFHDIRSEVNDLVNDNIKHTDLFLLVVDVSRGVSGHDVKTLKSLEAEGKPVLICLNKVDMLRPNDKANMIQVAKERLQNPCVIETAFDPDPRLSQDGPVGARDVFDWVVGQLEELGKETAHLKAEQK
ncbi:50S ribosome-binding GTPase [Pectobacterium aquaticum]|uniref:GTPase n=1 Tax=Dickeya dadantii TaxID=204038 RepID=UPI0019692A08|nr:MULTISPECIES: GTPase [Pectobacteriaceae]MBN3066189.1 50S ribosome-binding GTPase [Pectobacterium aquaticum]MCA7012471.1 50S ribosome-binding GTPase [Dickeya dadantii]